MKIQVAHVLTSIAILQFYLPLEGARILAVLPLYARSHHRIFQPLLRALARADHEVVVYSPFPLDKPEPNYTDVFMDNVTTVNENIKRLTLKYTDIPYYKCADLFVDVLDLVFDDFIKSDQIQQLLTAKERFDLVVTETFHAQEFTVILGHIFKAHVIRVQTSMTDYVINSNMGNTLSIAHIPDLCSPFFNNMSFFERFLNAFYVWRNLYYVYYDKYMQLLEQTMRKYFPDAPPVSEMMNNVSLVFVNDHLTADYAQPRTPNIFPVAGIHIEELKPLPKDIQEFMDGAADGVIFFSLGSYVHDELRPQEYFDTYNNVFRQLKQRVLWKTRKESIQGLPDNVMTVKWAPQQDVLAHPNCVLFITHGGLLSQNEAIHFGVPVVAIPQFYDQHRNARFYEEKKIGVQLSIRDLTEINILSAIRKVLENTQYTNNMKRLSSVYRDLPMTPAETVVYWTEYVLRHGGAHMRPASTQLSWYQLALLDVYAVFLAGIVSVTLVIYYICNRLYVYIYNKIIDITHKKKYNKM